EAIMKSFGDDDHPFPFGYPVKDERCCGPRRNCIAGYVQQRIRLPQPFRIDWCCDRTGTDGGEVQPFFGIFESEALRKTGNCKLRGVVECLHRVRNYSTDR